MMFGDSLSFLKNMYVFTTFLLLGPRKKLEEERVYLGSQREGAQLIMKEEAGPQEYETAWLSSVFFVLFSKFRSQPMGATHIRDRLSHSFRSNLNPLLQIWKLNASA